MLSEGVGQLKKSKYLFENRIRDLSAYSIMLQTTTLPPATFTIEWIAFVPPIVTSVILLP